MIGRVMEGQKRVARLAERAGQHRRDAQAHREHIRAWQRNHIGRLETLAWVYAAGVTWGITRPTSEDSTARKSHTLRWINTALVATRVIGRVTPEAAGDAVAG